MNDGNGDPFIMRKGLCAIFWIRDPDTGENLPIEKDEAFSEAFGEWLSANCEHPGFEKRRVEVNGGGIQVRSCCTLCGEPHGNPEKQDNAAWVASLPFQPAASFKDYQSRRHTERDEILLEHARRQLWERGQFTRNYRAYLESPEWMAIRQRVIARCSNVCEGCGNSPVGHVHHTTYRHFGNEFLFELLGLCRPCHDRIHAEDDAK